MTEIWKDIKGYEGLYQVSNCGRVKNTKRNKPVRHAVNKKSLYRHLILRKNKKQINHSLHRLIAIAFIPNPNNLPQINHIDGDKGNNIITNLEWCNASHNLKHAFKMGLCKMGKGANCHNAKPIIMKTIDGKELRRFGAIIEAAEITGIKRSSISKNLNGNNKTAYGYKFEYAKAG